jgi:RNA polymerase sigma factor (TIGR02999 family)
MSWQDRGQLYRLAAHAMREILVDHARKRLATRRGKGQRPVALEQAGEPAARRDRASVLPVHDALAVLEKKYPSLAEIVELHHFGGWTLDEIAPMLGITKEAAKSRWRTAKARVHQILSAEGSADGR